MDLDFTDDQIQLRQAVRRWIDKAYTPERRRRNVAEGGFDRQAHAELAGLGLTGLCVAEDHGGLGLGPIEAMVVMEELGRGLVLEPLAQTFIAGTVLSGHAPQPLRSRWLPPLIAGEALIVLAHQEPDARYRLDHCNTSATPGTQGWSLSGSKTLVPAGDQADAWLVPARTGGRLGLFLVERQAPGVRTQGYLMQDGSRAADVHLSGVAATLICEDGLPVLELAAAIGLASSCAQAVGAMELALALTADYLKTRRQFGVEIASFQALRHRLADMKTQLELARGMSGYASLMLGRPAAERRQALARAKVQIGRSMRFVGQQAVQLHGGIALTDEYVMSHCFKTLTQLEMSWGDTLHHLAVVSDGMRDEAGVFA